MPKRFELTPAINRKDYFCLDCKEITSVYLKGDGPGKMRGRVAFCAWCGENANVEVHNTRKHGGVTGRRHWSLSELNRLKELLTQPVTWQEIVTALDHKHSLGAIRRTAYRHGWEKQTDMRGKTLTEEERQMIAADPRSQQKLADEYGVDKKTIWNIKRRYG